MLSIPHIIVIFIVVLVIFGPEKLPELARNFGKVMAEFRRATGDLRSSFDAHMRDLEREAESRRIGGNATASASSGAVATPAAPSAQCEPAPPSPGTVPSNPPNAAALPSPRTQEPPEKKYSMEDPYIPGMEFDAATSGATSQPSEPEKSPDQVTDGSARSA